jgi:hypothetical protein
VEIPPPPCIKLPQVPPIPKVNIFGIAELQAFVDNTNGLANECSMTINLMGQLSPFLASVTCLLRMMAIIAKIIDVLKVVTDPLSLPEKMKDLLEAVAKAAGCFGIVLGPLSIIQTIKQILQLIINLLSCLIREIKSLLEVKVGLNFEAAEGNPALLAALECAQNNADVSMEHLMASMEPLQPLLDMISLLADIAQLPIELPDMSKITITAGVDPTQALQPLQDVVDTLQAVIDSLPV